MCVQRRLRWLDRRHPWLLDSLIVLIVVTVTVLGALFGDDDGGPFGDDDGGPFGDDRGPFGVGTASVEMPLGLLLAVTVGVALPLWWRRRAPTATFAVIAVAGLVPWSFGLWQLAAVCLVVSLHNLALHGSLRVLGWAAVAALAQVSVAVWFLLPTNNPPVAMLMLVSQSTAGVALGLTIRSRRLHLAAVEDRAARLEIEREQRERLTAAAERSRVAREMHDIVGHNLVVVVGLADGAATLAASRGEQAAEALRIIGDTGRQAMGELRRVLNVLASDESEDVRAQVERLSPQPGIVDLEMLLARVRAAGVSVTYRTAGDLSALGSGVQLTVYRIVQEALTNTLKHVGSGADADVTVAVENGGIRVRVTDTGPSGARAAGPSTADAGVPGHGLVGIRQRTAMYGGTVTAGPRGDRPGWIVDVTLEAPPASALPAPGDQAT
ncbi:two-component sensor histidine kinase [Saccharothrix sp. ALI-22-I]|nr:two-component sensor histidine kinase [Saccharothrix sp. ALI-22-I]